MRQIADNFVDMICQMNDRINQLETKVKLLESQTKIEKRYSIEEATLYLGIAKGTLYNLINQDKITHYKTGKQIFFLINDLDNYIQTRKFKSENDVRKPITLKQVFGT